MFNALPNIEPTEYDLLTFSEVSYRQGRTRHDVFLSRGFQIFKEIQDVNTGLRLLCFLPAWFPTSRTRHSFNYRSLPKDLTIGFVFRGTDSDLVPNLTADLELIWLKLTASDLPEIANQALRSVMEILKELQQNHPALDKRGVRLKVVASGHSLGGFLAEVVTVLLHEFCDKEHIHWCCKSFESPGLPDPYMELALSDHDPCYWDERITTFLAAPNPINMLHKHLGKVVHVRIPFAQTMSYMAKCIAVDAGRLYVVKAAIGGAVAAARAITSDVGIGTQLRTAAVELVGGMWAGTTSSAGCEAMTAICSILGVEVCELMEQHRLFNFYPCFDHDDGCLLPEYKADMLSWPYLGSFKQTLTQLLQATLLSLLPSFVCPSNMGWMNIRDRNGMIQRRYASLPGYVPVPGSQPQLQQKAEGEESHVKGDPASEPGVAAPLACISAVDSGFAAWRNTILGKRRKPNGVTMVHSLGTVRRLSLQSRASTS